jgi:molecular chaperone DnaK
MAVVGIDLGTTNSLVAFLDDGRPTIIPNRGGARSTPSVVALDRNDRLHVGASARNQLVAMPERSIAEVKRLMGTSEKVRLGDRTYGPQEISGLILRALREDAEAFLGESVPEAVVTVPAYFTDAQRQATKDAGELAGLKVERILNEPTAAALAYGLDHLEKEQHVLVYDLGGGTFDVSVLEMFSGVLDVKASAGNGRLGGGDFDRAIVGWLAEVFEREHRVDLRKDRQAVARLTDAAEKAKIELSTAASTTILLPFLAVVSGEPRSLEIELSREKLEELVGPLVRSTLEPVAAALSDARLGRDAIHEIVLVGGASRMPLVRRLVAEFFGKEPRSGVNPDEAVALGAAVQAGLKTGAISAQTGIMITDVAPFTLGVEVQSSAGSQNVVGVFSPIIPRNSTIPISRTETYATTGDGQEKVTIKVFQGESRFTKHNVYLDQYTIDGVPPAPAGKEKVAVTFTYDVNGILNVTTKVVSTGKQTSLVIDKSPRRMNDQERSEARERLDREWSGAPSAAPEERAIDVSGLEALIAAARAKANAKPGPDGARLDALVAEGERAIAARDPAAVTRVDLALTDLLFELG